MLLGNEIIAIIENYHNYWWDKCADAEERGDEQTVMLCNAKCMVLENILTDIEEEGKRKFDEMNAEIDAKIVNALLNNEEV